MDLNTENLKSKLKNQIENLENQKRRLRKQVEEQIRGIDDKVKNIHLTLEALDTVVRQVAVLEEEQSPTEEVSQEAVQEVVQEVVEEAGQGFAQDAAREEEDYRAEQDCRESQPLHDSAPFEAEGFTPTDLPAEEPEPAPAEELVEEDEETLRMVESLFVESDSGESEATPTNGRRHFPEEALTDAEDPVLAGQMETDAETTEDGSDSYVPRFLKKYI